MVRCEVCGEAYSGSNCISKHCMGKLENIVKENEIKTLRQRQAGNFMALSMILDNKKNIEINQALKGCATVKALKAYKVIRKHCANEGVVLPSCKVKKDIIANGDVIRPHLGLADLPIDSKNKYPKVIIIEHNEQYYALATIRVPEAEKIFGLRPSSICKILSYEVLIPEDKSRLLSQPNVVYSAKFSSCDGKAKEISGYIPYEKREKLMLDKVIHNPSQLFEIEKK